MAKKKQKRKIAVIDCETDPFLYGRIPVPFIWGYYDGDEYHQFSSTRELVDFLRERRIICYAHNGGKFDWHFCLDFIDEFEDGQDITIINGRLSKFQLGQCECRDSYNILPIGLAAFEKQSFDYSILEKHLRDIPENRIKIEEYLKSDCVNLYNMVTAFINEYGVNLTLAGTALKQWKLISGNDVPSSKDYYYDYFAPYYCGGRVQCFREGLINEDFSVVDINSAYPRAMMENHAYGLGYEMVEELPDLEDEDFERGFYSFLGTAQNSLPFREPESGKLLFPNDNVEREYHVTGWELKAALETNSCTINKFVRGFVHYEFENFEKYITYFYEKRLKAKKEGDKANDLFSKLLMNSLYGKFASNPKKYKNHHITGNEQVKDATLILDDEGESNGLKFAGYLGKWFVIESPLDESEMRFYNVATAASITGYVRAFLWRSIHAVGIENVLYCDTDSLASKSIAGLELGTELGKWKHEGDFIYAAIAGKKLYAFLDKFGNWKSASKGARLTPDEIMEVANGGSAYYRFDAPAFSITHEPSFIERNIMMTNKGENDE